MVEDSLTKYLHCMLDTRFSDKTKIPLVDQAITAKLEKEMAVVFTDMSDFTSRVHKYGIIPYLSSLHQGVKMARPLIEKHSGELIKLEGDSLLMVFRDVPSAVTAAKEINGHYQEFNNSVPEEERIEISFGIGFGKILKTESDAFGEEINLASKLGEDLAYPGEILLTQSAYWQVKHMWPFREAHSINFGSFRAKGYKLIG